MKHSIFSLLSVVLLFFSSHAQAQLNQGDIVVAGLNPVTDTVHLVPLVDIPSGTTVVITDVGWLSTNAFHTTLTGDGTATWTTTALVPKGSLIKLVLGGLDNSPATELTNLTTSASYTSQVVFSGYTVNDPILVTGDQIFIYQGAASNPSFIFGLNNSAGTVGADNWNTVDTPTQTVSRLPNGTGSQNSLTNGVNAIGLPGGGLQQDNVQYTGPTTATDRATWLTRFANSANWTGDNTGSTATSITPGTGITIATPTTITSLNRVNTTPSNAGTVNWTLTFASAVSGVTASNFSLSGTAATGASVSAPTTSNGGVTWNVPVTTGSTDGTLTLSLANATGLSASITTSLPFAGQSYAMDKTAPTIGIGSPSVSSIAAGAGSVTYTVTYADTNFNASTLANGNITLNSTGTASGTVGISGSGTTRTVTISSITGAGTIGISIAAGTASDTAGNTAPAAGPSGTFAVLAPPTVTTGAATGITGTSAVLNGSANANGSTTTLIYEWGQTTSYGNTVSMGTTNGAPTSLPNTISGLTPGTEYHFRLVGISAGGTTNGADQSFITLSNNANLAALTTTASGFAPTFSAGTIAYTANVPNATTSVTVTATRADANATLEVRVNSGSYTALTSGVASSALALNVGTNPIDVRVTAQNGTTQKTYTITVTRAAADYDITTGAGLLTITDNAGNADTLAITEPSAGNILFTATGRSFSLNGAAATTNNSGSISLSGITSIVVNAAAGADTVSVAAFAAASYAISVNGGADADTLSLAGSYGTAIANSTGSGAGNVTLDSTKVISFASVEAVNASSATIGSLTATLDPTAAFSGNVITTVAAVDAGVNTNISFGSSGLGSIKLGTVTGTLTIQGDNIEQDYFVLQGLGTAMAGHFVVDGLGGDSDVIEVNNATLTVSGLNKNLSLKADFIGMGRLNAASPADQPGVIVCSGGITLEADGDSTVTTPPLWGASGVWGASTPAYFNASQVPYTSRGSIQIMGDIRKTSGSDATLTLKAKHCIVMPNTATTGAVGSIVSTSNKLHVIMNSDSDASGAGNVMLLAKSAVTTNGGDLTIGGGANPLSEPAYGVVGATTTAPGVSLTSTVLTTGGGNVNIAGRGAANASGVGVLLNVTAGSATNSTISSGSGAVIIYGSGGGNTTNTFGMLILGNGTAPALDSQILTTTGNVTIYATAFRDNIDSMRISSRGSIVSSGGGTISINAQKPISSHPTTTLFNMNPASGETATVLSTGGNIIISADTMSLNGGAGTESISTGSSSSGMVTLRPILSYVPVELGAGVLDVGGSAGVLGIDAITELPVVTAGTLRIGSTSPSAGPVTIRSVIAPATFTTLDFGGTACTFTATSGFAADVTSASNYEKIVVANSFTNTVTIDAGATFSVNAAGGYVWNGSDSFTFLDNDDADAITGTFTGPTLTNFLGSTLTAGQNYAGGTGNDFVIGAPPSNNADLSALVVNTATISPVFGAATTSYTASVPNGTTSVTVTPTRAQANATIEARVGANPLASVTSGSPSGALALNVGSNTIEVKVTAQDGTTTKTYSIAVTRRSILQDWRFGFFSGDFSGSGNMANGLDFDSDGKSNLLEFAFGTDPTSGSSGPPDLTMTGTYAAAVFGTTGQPTVKLEPITNGVDFRALFIRRADHAAAGLTYTPQFSADDFGTFTASVVAPTVLATSGGFELVSVPYPHFLPNGKKARYFRVTVNITP